LFVGEQALLRGNESEAEHHFELAGSTCNKNDLEYGTAMAELRRAQANGKPHRLKLPWRDAVLWQPPPT